MAEPIVGNVLNLFRLALDPARADELTLSEVRTRAEHVADCARCATEAAAYSRLGHALAVMANLEVDPAVPVPESR